MKAEALAIVQQPAEKFGEVPGSRQRAHELAVAQLRKPRTFIGAKKKKAPVPRGKRASTRGTSHRCDAPPGMRRMKLSPP
ncbi:MULTISPECIES: hypothetical protein [Cupriavidus]|uniref:hypothetical protein n=1 Tax=Cupriavidus sp. DF5525 TaxID=3160989 RepID=UPI0032DF8085